jgi:GntR family transcriptional regulator
LPAPSKTVDRRVLFALDAHSGVPSYRQIIDQVLGGIASGTLRPGDQLPTVRQLAVDLAINPNTVVRAYRELEIREVLSTQQGTGTFLTDKKPPVDGLERRRRIAQLCGELLSRAGTEGIELAEILGYLNEVQNESGRRT